MWFSCLLAFPSHIQTYKTWAPEQILYGGKLWHCKNWQNWWLTKNLPNFYHQNFYTSIVKSHVSGILSALKNIEQIEDIFLGTHPTTCKVPSIVFLIATACRSFEFPTSRSQSKSPSAKGLSHLDCRAEQLIDLIDNCDYWEINNVQTIIVMTIIHMVYKKGHQKLHYAGCFDAKCSI